MVSNSSQKPWQTRIDRLTFWGSLAPLLEMRTRSEPFRMVRVKWGRRHTHTNGNSSFGQRCRCLSTYLHYSTPLLWEISSTTHIHNAHTSVRNDLWKSSMWWRITTTLYCTEVQSLIVQFLSEFRVWHERNNERWMFKISFNCVVLRM